MSQESQPQVQHAVPDAMRMQDRSRRFVVVVNNLQDPQAGMDTLQTHYGQNLTYAIVAREGGAAGTTPHLHMYVVLRDRARYTTVRAQMAAMFPGAHTETAYANSARNRKYSMKEGDWVEYGTPPEDTEAENLANWRSEYKDKHEEAIALARAGRFDEINPAMRLRFHRSLSDIAIKVPMTSDALDHQAGIWVWGPKGTRKTSVVYAATNDTHYEKSQDEWWDGYRNEGVVVIDELDKRKAKLLVGKLKVWAGHTKFKAEYKGGSHGDIRPRCLIITANFSPEEVFTDRTVDLDPILKRFTVIPCMAPGDISPDDIVRAMWDLPKVITCAPATIAMPPGFVREEPQTAHAAHEIPSVTGLGGVPTATPVTLGNPCAMAAADIKTWREERMRMRAMRLAVTELERGYREMAVLEYGEFMAAVSQMRQGRNELKRNERKRAIRREKRAHLDVIDVDEL